MAIFFIPRGVSDEFKTENESGKNFAQGMRLGRASERAEGLNAKVEADEKNYFR